MSPARWIAYALAVVVVAACTLLNWLLSQWLSLTDLAMVYLLGVVAIAIRYPTTVSLSAALLSLLSFDFFFVPPVMDLRFGRTEHLITGVVLLSVGAVTSLLAARVRREMQLANQAAMVANEEQLRNSLLASLSHDIRTPLAVIAGSASTLQENRSRLSAAEQDELLNAIFEHARNMSLEVNDILEMTRLHAGPVTLRREWHPLEELVGASLERCKSKLSAHRLTVDVTPDIPMIHVDGVLVEKLLVNLMENAAKYTPMDSRIRISATRNGGRIDVIVEDDGPGLPPGLEERLFDKFVRARSEGGPPGSGLGLSICRAIAQLHGMTIRGRTLPEGGAQFVVSMPYLEPPLTEASMQDSES